MEKRGTADVDGLVFTFHISVPVFAILQVHVDVCTQLCCAGGQNAEDLVLIKSRFLQTAHLPKKRKKSLFLSSQIQQNSFTFVLNSQIFQI